MVSVEGLRRTGEYIKNVAARSMGVWYYSEIGKQNKILKEIGHPNDSVQMGRIMLVVLYTLLSPAVINFSVSKEEDQPSDAKICSKFIAGSQFLSLLSIDLAPLITPIAVEAATNNPLYFLSLLGKPLCSMGVHLASDIVDVRAFRKKDSPRANSGTYALLEKIYDESYDPNLKSGIIRDSQGEILAVVSKEEVCARTGGSCMELILPKTEGEESWIEFAHVTEKDIVVNTGSEKTPKTPPKIEELMGDLKKSLSQTESPILP